MQLINMPFYFIDHRYSGQTMLQIRLHKINHLLHLYHLLITMEKVV